MEIKNIYENLPFDKSEEIFETIIENEHLKLERIISSGQSTPPGEWYDQDRSEWVVLLTGSASILFETENETIDMKPGDYVHIPAHIKHRVEKTSSKTETIWLALHFTA